MLQAFWELNLTMEADRYNALTEVAQYIIRDKFGDKPTFAMMMQGAWVGQSMVKGRPSKPSPRRTFPTTT